MTENDDVELPNYVHLDTAEQGVHDAIEALDEVEQHTWATKVALALLTISKILLRAAYRAADS